MKAKDVYQMIQVLERARAQYDEMRGLQSHADSIPAPSPIDGCDHEGGDRAPHVRTDLNLYIYRCNKCCRFFVTRNDGEYWEPARILPEGMGLEESQIQSLPTTEQRDTNESA